MSNRIEYLVRYTTNRHRPVTPIHGPILHTIEDARGLASYARQAHPGAEVWIEKTVTTTERIEAA